jgi:prepilin signal peptidase PulO-like enzyme (type II secretory pathway)
MNKLQEIAEQLANEENQWVEDHVMKLLTSRQRIMAHIPVIRNLLRWTSGITIFYTHSFGSRKIEIHQNGKRMFAKNKVLKGI